jgi:metal-responsive CopG/Arc/MetJ family transcriptional regulator
MSSSKIREAPTSPSSAGRGVVTKTQKMVQLSVKVEAALVARLDRRVKSLGAKIGRTASRADAIRAALVEWLREEEKR